MKYPVILFWTDKENLNKLKNITCLCPNSTYTTRDIQMMDWRGGDCYANKSIDDLVHHWYYPVTHEIGINIDELLNFKFNNMRKLLKALIELKKKNLGFVGVWHSIYLWFKSAKVYNESVDLVMIEMYSSAKSSIWLWLRLMPSYFVAKMTGVWDKTIFALKIDDTVKRTFKYKWIAGVPDEKTLEKQMRFIKKHCPDMAGIGFYESGGSEKLLRKADELAGRIFGR